MKVKTSITLPKEVLQELASLGTDFKNRSHAIEQAVLFFLQKRREQLRESKDLQIINQKHKELNKEAKDALSYQVDL